MIVKKLLLLAVAMIAAALPALADDFLYTYEGSRVKYRTIDDQSCEVISGGQYTGQVIIPSSVTLNNKPYSVVAISSFAFSECSGLTSITIPNSVTSIGIYAFEGCNKLTSLTIPNSVTSIGGRAFYNCSRLTSVIIGNSVTSIGKYVFYGCTGLKKSAYPKTLSNPFDYGNGYFHGVMVVYDPEGAIIENDFIFGPEKSRILFVPHTLDGEYIIPNSVTSIGNGAFRNCNGLISVVIPNSVTSIGYEAYQDCTSLTSVTIPNSVTEIGGWAFSYCSGLTSAVIPNSVDSISHTVFIGCTGLKKSAYPKTLSNPFRFGEAIAYEPQGTIVEDGFVFGPNKSSILFAPYSLTGEYVISNSITSVGVSAFAGCKNLSSIEFGTGIRAISDNAFAGCGLSKVVLPPAVDSIGNSAFAGNAYLTEVAIGPNVKSISDKAFDNTPLERVYITAPQPPVAPYSAFSRYTAKLYVQGENAVNAYYDATRCWDRFEGSAMSVPTRINIEMPDSLPRNAGAIFTLKATLEPVDVDLPYVFWRSTNPEIAYVDNYGNVTVRQDIPPTGDVKIIAETLYHNGPTAYFSFNSVTTDTDEVLTDMADELAPVDVYNLQGVQVLCGAQKDAIDTLSPGIYIVRQGSRTSKIAVK